MLCTIIKHTGYYPCYNLHEYVLEAENGVIDREEAKELYAIGTVFDLPDEEWSLDTEEYYISCDACEHVYSKKTVPGGIVSCFMCGHEERV